MTRYGIISDIHGNLHALQAVLARLDHLQVDQIICLGDIVGYGPFPAQCIDLVLQRSAVTISGNHEEAAINPQRAVEFNGPARQAALWTHRRLRPRHLQVLRDLPAIHHLDEGILLVHDSPVPGPSDYIHDHRMATLALRGMDRRICLIGHTHVPVVFEAPSASVAPELSPDDVVMYQLEDGAAIELDALNRYICNPGSVGQPRDYDPRASFAVLDVEAATFTVHREEYDIDAAQAATQAAGLPPILAERLAVGV